MGDRHIIAKQVFIPLTPISPSLCLCLSFAVCLSVSVSPLIVSELRRGVSTIVFLF
jgi:hypothetical protein